MASFKPHYSLCPLLGGNSLVGIRDDKEKESLLITLGANIVVAHKLTDQKPSRSWSTRQTNKFTSPAVYDSGKIQYIGVLNHKHVCIWQDDTSNLEDAKKHTFQVSIQSAHLSHKLSQVVVVYETGFSENLDVAIQTRKDSKPSLTAAGEKVESSFLETVQDSEYLVLFTTKFNVFCVKLNSDGTPEGHFVFSIQQAGTNILGKCIINAGTSLNVLVLYSNGKVVQYSEKGSEVLTHNISGISLGSKVAMAALDATRVAIYASDVSREGAVLLLMDLKFGITVASRKLKFFCDPPVLHCDYRNKVLLLCVGQNLVVVPYQLQPSLLSALVGKRQSEVAVLPKPELGTWGQDDNVDTMQWDPCDNIPKLKDPKAQELAKKLWNSGASHAKLLEDLLPTLKESADLDGIQRVLEYVGDVPEKLHAELLSFSLQVFDQEKGTGKALLDLLLRIPHSAVLLLGHLRTRVSTSGSLKLMKYLSFLLANSQFMSFEPSSEPSLEQVLNWASLILDSHYSQLLLSGAEGEVHGLVEELKKLVVEKYEFFEAVGDLEPIVNSLQQKKKLPQNRRNDWYAIEVVQLF